MAYQPIHLKYAPLDKIRAATAETAITIFSIVFFMLYDLLEFLCSFAIQTGHISLRWKTG